VKDTERLSCFGYAEDGSWYAAWQSLCVEFACEDRACDGSRFIRADLPSVNDDACIVSELAPPIGKLLLAKVLEQGELLVDIGARGARLEVSVLGESARLAIELCVPVIGLLRVVGAGWQMNLTWSVIAKRG
jgi:hypothetical protein